MRLMKKSEVEKLKILERKREQDEGLKLARRVDSLRELAANEESKYTKFRDGMIGEIQKQINEKQAELDALERMIKNLKSNLL